jgi:hypothetical protein
LGKICGPGRWILELSASEAEKGRSQAVGRGDPVVSTIPGHLRLKTWPGNHWQYKFAGKITEALIMRSLRIQTFLTFQFTKITSVAVASLLCGMLSVPFSGSVARADDDLTSAIKAARDNFKPINDDQLAAAKADLLKQMQALEKFVNPKSDNGKNWLTYLSWDDAKKELAGDSKPDLGPLTITYQQLNRDENGLELAPFRRVSDSLWKYINLSGLSRSDNQADVYGKKLDVLAGELDEYQKQPSAALASTIGRRMEVFSVLGQSPELATAVKSKFAQPNALVDASAKLLSASAGETLNRMDPITDTILGTSVHGTGHTTGSVAAKTVPSADRATVQLTTKGHTESENVGRNGPAVIRSTAHTDFTADKIVELSDQTFKAKPAKVDAHVKSDVHSVSKAGGGLGSNLVARMGMSQVQQKHAQADSIATNHAQGRISRRVDQEVSDKLAKARKRYDEDYRLPLARRGELPDDIQFSTTDDALLLQLTQASHAQLGAPTTPPELPTGKDLVVRVHESATNNYLASLLGGATISEDDPEHGTKADVPLPKWLRDAWENRLDKHASANDPDFQPWSLKFNGERPIEVAFTDDNKVHVTLHIAHLSSGHEFTRWDVTGTFTPELAGGGITLRRQDLDAYPVDKDLKPLASHSSTQAGEKQNLLDELTKRSDQGRGFPKTIEIKEINPTGDFAKAGPLAANEFTAKNGWLTVAWNRE